MNKSYNFNIEFATKDDMLNVSDMIRELAEFEKMASEPVINAKDLIKDGFDCDNPWFFCLIAKNDQNEPLGYAMFFYMYSSWVGKAMCLEDIYVKPQYRKLGIGKALYEKVIEIAKEKECKHLDFMVLSWNPATHFYKKLGCTDITITEDWHIFRKIF